MNEVFRLENGGIHLPVLAACSMLYDGMRTAGVNNGIRHRAYSFQRQINRLFVLKTLYQADLKPDPNFDISLSSVRQFFSTPNTAFCAENRHS